MANRALASRLQRSLAHAGREISLDRFVNAIYKVNVIYETISPRRQRRRAKRVESIVAAAMDLVVEQGFGGLTMTRLADALDLSAGALYRYFDSKDALVAELQRRGLTMIQSRFDQRRKTWSSTLPSDPELAAVCELLLAARFYLDLARDEPQLQRWIAVSLSMPRRLTADLAAEHVAPAFSGLLLSVSELFHHAVSAGGLCRGHSLERTVIFWSSLQGVTSAGHLQRLAPQSQDGWYDVPRLGDELTRTLLRGWGASTNTLEQAQAWLDCNLETT